MRVGYTPYEYEEAQKIEDNLTHFAIFRALWYIRIREWAMLPFSSPKDWAVRPRVHAWERISAANHEVGSFCLVDEMQVLTPTSWTGVRMHKNDWKNYLT